MSRTAVDEKERTATLDRDRLQLYEQCVATVSAGQHGDLRVLLAVWTLFVNLRLLSPDAAIPPHPLSTTCTALTKLQDATKGHRGIDAASGVPAPATHEPLPSPPVPPSAQARLAAPRAPEPLPHAGRRPPSSLSSSSDDDDNDADAPGPRGGESKGALYPGGPYSLAAPATTAQPAAPAASAHAWLDNDSDEDMPRRPRSRESKEPLYPSITSSFAAPVTTTGGAAPEPPYMSAEVENVSRRLAQLKEEDVRRGQVMVEDILAKWAREDSKRATRPAASSSLTPEAPSTEAGWGMLRGYLNSFAQKVGMARAPPVQGMPRAIVVSGVTNRPLREIYPEDARLVRPCVPDLAMLEGRGERVTAAIRVYCVMARGAHLIWATMFDQSTFTEDVHARYVKTALSYTTSDIRGRFTDKSDHRRFDVENAMLLAMGTPMLRYSSSPKKVPEDPESMVNVLYAMQELFALGIIPRDTDGVTAHLRRSASLDGSTADDRVLLENAARSHQISDLIRVSLDSCLVAWSRADTLLRDLELVAGAHQAAFALMYLAWLHYWLRHTGCSAAVFGFLERLSEHATKWFVRTAMLAHDKEAVASIFALCVEHRAMVTDRTRREADPTGYGRLAQDHGTLMPLIICLLVDADARKMLYGNKDAMPPVSAAVVEALVQDVLQRASESASFTKYNITEAILYMRAQRDVTPAQRKNDVELFYLTLGGSSTPPSLSRSQKR
jgi:hypothetical protein